MEHLLKEDIESHQPSAKLRRALLKELKKQQFPAETRSNWFPLWLSFAMCMIFIVVGTQTLLNSATNTTPTEKNIVAFENSTLRPPFSSSDMSEAALIQQLTRTATEISSSTVRESAANQIVAIGLSSSVSSIDTHTNTPTELPPQESSATSSFSSKPYVVITSSQGTESSVATTATKSSAVYLNVSDATSLDLVVTLKSTTTFYAGESGTVVIEVHNASTQTIDATDLSTLWENQKDTQILKQLQPDEKRLVSLRHMFPLQGTYTVTVTVDPEKKLAEQEAQRKNNQREIQINVEPAL